MTANFTLLALIGILVACGVYLLLERRLTRMLIGFLMLGNGVNLLVLTSGGPAGDPPLHGREAPGRGFTADPLAQGMILTAIVIAAGVAAFVLALAYRSFQLLSADVVEDDPEDTRIARSSLDPTERPDRDRSDDPTTGEATPAGDAFGAPTGEAPMAHPDEPEVEPDPRPRTAGRLAPGRRDPGRRENRGAER